MKFKRLLVGLLAGIICLPVIGYGEDVSVLRQKAERGDAEAQISLGNCYYKGRGVPQDYKEAAKWSRLSAEQGNARAQNNLGYCYSKGQGVPQDYKESVKWYRLAAEQGYAEARTSLGTFYKAGKTLARIPHAEFRNAEKLPKRSERLFHHFVLLVFFVATPIPNPGRFHSEDSGHLVAPPFIRACFFQTKAVRRRRRL